MKFAILGAFGPITGEASYNPDRNQIQVFSNAELMPEDMRAVEQYLGLIPNFGERQIVTHHHTGVEMVTIWNYFRR